MIPEKVLYIVAAIIPLMLGLSALYHYTKLKRLKNALKAHKERCQYLERYHHELDQAHKTISSTIRRYGQLFDHLKDEYIFFSQTPEGELSFLATGVLPILGYPANTPGLQWGQLLTDNHINRYAIAHKQACLEGKKTEMYTAELRAADGSCHIFEVTELAMIDETGNVSGIDGVMREITKELKSEDQIKEKEEKYRLLFNKASDFIFFYRIDNQATPGKFIEVNDYTLERLGYSREELYQMTLDDLTNPGWEAIGSGDEDYQGNKKYEQVWQAKNDDLIDVEIISHDFTLNKRAIGIAIARDITERKRAEGEIRFVNEELLNQKENLEALVDNLTQTQEQLVQSEKLAALGQLIAGVAHEVNTPLGAIKAAIGNLNDSLSKALNGLPLFIEKQDPEDIALFLKVIALSGYDSDSLSAREKRMFKKELSVRLQKEGIQAYDNISDLMIYLNIHNNANELLTSLKSENAENVLRTSRYFASIVKNTRTIELAADKATKVVFALKKYVHRDVQEEMVRTDIIDSLETVLTLYQNQLKLGVEIVRKYDTLPMINCYPDEVNQVWTNLIHNSLQAMNQKGTLTITARNENTRISVSIGDTGCGIEPDIQDRIFEPFYTTKKQGEGSGLGLDIVKKIVEKHNGEITFVSELGKGTEFTVWLPLNELE